VFGVTATFAPAIGPDARRLAHRHVFLALDFLHQSAAGVGDDVGGLVMALVGLAKSLVR
jgi:hypothetical protein